MCIASPNVKGEGTGEGKERDSGGANSVCQAGHGGTRVARRVSTDLGRFKKPLGHGWLTRVAATGTPRGTWSRGRRGQKRPSRWCSGRCRLARRGAARKGLMEISGWTISPLPASSDHRVRPMSAAELRRGEQSVLHCSGTRTLQVRTSTPRPPPPQKKPPSGNTPGPSRSISPRPRPPRGELRPPQGAPASSLRPPSPGEPPGRGPGRGFPLRRGAGRSEHPR